MPLQWYWRDQPVRVVQILTGQASVEVEFADGHHEVVGNGGFSSRLIPVPVRDTFDDDPIINTEE